MCILISSNHENRWIAAINKALQGQPLVESVILENIQEIAQEESTACCSFVSEWQEHLMRMFRKRADADADDWWNNNCSMS